MSGFNGNETVRGESIMVDSVCQVSRHDLVNSRHVLYAATGDSGALGTKSLPPQRQWLPKTVLT